MDAMLAGHLCDDAALYTILLVVVIITAVAVHKQRRAPFPPGPIRVPFLGSLFLLTKQKEDPWITFTELAQTYGDVIGVEIMGTKMLVLNSLEAILDLLDKRGAHYSHRPILTVAGELMGLNQAMSLKPYGSEWKACRKLEHIALSSSAVKEYHPMQERFAAMLAHDIVRNPQNFYDLSRLCAARIVLALTYGISAGVLDREYISFAEDTMKLVGRSVIPGAFICDIFPFLKYAPGWVPFKRYASRGREMIESMVKTPFERVKSELESGCAGPSLAATLLGAIVDSERSAEMEERIKWTTGSMYSAGGESTFGTTLVFFIAMALHPEAQRKAQEEIDTVIGLNRLPTVSDRAELPYVTSVVKEVMRWHPILPLGFARRNAEDDEYKGYYIPKDTIVSPNVWAVAFQPNEKYPPHQFCPERFLDSDCPTVDPSTWAFGFGRRGCPGKQVGEASVFILMATLLCTLDIAPPAGSQEPWTVGYEGHFVNMPNRFDCRLDVRSAEKQRLLESMVQNY